MAGIIGKMNALNAVRASWKARASALLAALQTWPWMDTARTLARRFREDRLGVTAGSLTFTTTMAMVPLLTVMLAVFTAFPMFGSFRAALERYFIQALIPPSIAKPVLATLTQFAAKASRMGSLGLALLLVTALLLILTIDRTLNGIWRVRQPRPIAQRVLVYWAAVTLGPLLLGVSLWVTSFAISASKGWVSDLPGGDKWLLSVVEFTLFTVAATGLFRYVPNVHVRWGHALAGGVFVASGITLAKKALGWYLGSASSYSSIYGAFATVPIFLLWLYVIWVIVLLGAVVAAYAPSLQMRVARHPPTPGHRFQLALMLLRRLDRARHGAQRGCSADDLAHQLRIDPLQIEPVLAALVELDMVGLLDEGDAARYVLLAEPAALPAAPLVGRLLLAPAPPVGAFWSQAGLDRMTVAELLGAAPPHAAPQP